jgi:hypothetical protein
MDTPREQERSPFVGPRPIETGELLYGRDREERDLVALLIAKRIVLLHSPSGAGKSSLVNAALIPALRAKHFRDLPVIRVNRDPPAIDGSLLGPDSNRYVLSSLLSLEHERDPDQHVDMATLVRLSLSEYLDRREAEIDVQDAVLLIFDQFEEILTIDPIDRQAKAHFFEQVGEALRNRRRFALFAVREEYVGTLDPYLQPIPTQLSVRMRLDLLSKEAARRAIQRPRPSGADEDLHLLTDNFTPEAAGKLAEDLAQIRVQQPDGTRLLEAGLHVEPVQLQVVCERLWRQAQERGESHVDVDALKDVGTVDEALAGYFAEKVEAIASRRDVPEWRIRHWFDHQLITAQGIRGQVLRDVGQSEGLENEVIEELIGAYLVRQERRRGVTWYELAHDRLVDPIRADNARWYQEHLSPFHDRALRWDAQERPGGMLLGEGDLPEMERWARERPEQMSSAETAFLEASRKERDQKQRERRGSAERRTNLADLGWGVIFAFEDRDRVPELIEALAELLALRQEGAGDRYREFAGPDAYRPGETAEEFLRRFGLGPTAVEPDKVPYYLLIVGDPETIPFDVQYALDVHHAVGRIHFDRPEDYARYARSVVAAERGQVLLPPQATFFGPQHPDDVATRFSSNLLVAPLADQMREAWPMWNVEAVLAGDATKAQLARLLGGDRTPALLFTASHASLYNPKVPYPLSYLGALVCQDWPGPGDDLLRDHFFAGEDVADGARLLGLVAFLFGGFTAGTPRLDNFAHRNFKEPEEIAPRALLARLPQRLLAHPAGGALAVVGHVDQSWTSSFTAPGTRDRDLQAFEQLFTLWARPWNPSTSAMRLWPPPWRLSSRRSSSTASPPVTRRNRASPKECRQ